MVFNSALIHVKNIGVSIVLGTISTIVSFYFIQTYASIVIGSVIVLFAGAGHFFAYWRKSGKWYAGIFIALPYYLTIYGGADDLNRDFIEILQKPGILTTVAGSFYLTLPAVALISVYVGIFISKKNESPMRWIDNRLFNSNQK